MVTQAIDSVVEQSKTRAAERKPWAAPQVITSAVEQETAKTLVSAGSDRHTSTSTIAS